MKHRIFSGDFNITMLDYEYNGKIKSFFDSMYQRNLIPTINNPIRTPTISKKKFSSSH